jgi:large subunit ribosomal protein L17
MLPTKAEVAEARKQDAVRVLFDEIAPALKDRAGGYTRIIKMHQRQGDASQLAILEWVELSATAPVQVETVSSSAPPSEGGRK